MSQDAGIDIDMDAELARLQARETARAAAEAESAEPGAGAKVITGQVVDDSRTVEFLGRRFRVADKIGVMPLLKFAQYADVSITDLRGLAAMYAMLRDCIHPGSPGCGECKSCAPPRCRECRNCKLVAEAENKSEDGLDCQENPPDMTRCSQYDPGDWKAFEDHAMETRADADDLFQVITDVTELIAGRPTRQLSGSSRGQRAISGGSTGRSSGRRAKGSRR